MADDDMHREEDQVDIEDGGDEVRPPSRCHLRNPHIPDAFFKQRDFVNQGFLKLSLIT